MADYVEARRGPPRLPGGTGAAATNEEDRVPAGRRLTVWVPESRPLGLSWGSRAAPGVGMIVTDPCGVVPPEEEHADRGGRIVSVTTGVAVAMSPRRGVHRGPRLRLRPRAWTVRSGGV